MDDFVKLKIEGPGRQDALYQIVLSDACRGFLPASMTVDGGDVGMVFFVSGFSRLNSLNSMKNIDLLNFFCALTEAVEACRNSLIWPEDMVLDGDTIYVSGDFRKVRLIFMPAESVGDKAFTGAGACEDSERGRLPEGIYRCVRRLLSSAGMEYLERIREILEREGLSILRRRGALEELKAEVRMSDVS